MDLTQVRQHTHTRLHKPSHTLSQQLETKVKHHSHRDVICAHCVTLEASPFRLFFFFIFNPPVSHKHTLVLILTVGTISHNHAQTDDSDASASPRSLRCHNICCFPAFWHCRCSETDGVFLMACILKLERFFFFFQAEHKLFNPLKTYFWCGVWNCHKLYLHTFKREIQKEMFTLT